MIVYKYRNQKLNLNLSATVLSRNPRSFQFQFPHLASNPDITFHPGNVRDFEFPQGAFSHIIHAAATSARSIPAA